MARIAGELLTLLYYAKKGNEKTQSLKIRNLFGDRPVPMASFQGIELLPAQSFWPDLT
jgi:hypothetical protein